MKKDHEMTESRVFDVSSRRPARAEAPKVNKSLYKALRILDCFTEATPVWSVSELSRALGISKSSVSTMLTLLADMDFVHQSPVTRRYELGLRCLELGYIASSRLVIRDYAFPYLEALLKRNRIVYMGTLNHDEVLYVEALFPAQRRINYSSVGRRAPLYCTAIGKALLAHSSSSYIQSYIEHTELKASTEFTITQPDRLREELEITRQRRYSTDRQEREMGIQCIGVPIFGGDGALIAAISISGPSTEITLENMPEVAEEALAASHSISMKLTSAGF
jgi:DNA-binding IclR family transcriptional regulator